MEHPEQIRHAHLRQQHAEVTLEDCQSAGGGHIFEGLRAKPLAAVIDVSIYGFGADPYEIKLHELNDEVDLFFILEMPVSHTGLPKPLFWEQVKDQQRFNDFKSKIVHVIINDLPEPRADEDLVSWQEENGMRKVRELLPQLLRGVGKGEAVMNFGDSDEVPSLRNTRLMRHCQPKALPVDSGVWMPMGLVDRAFSTDWPVSAKFPYTFGNPAFHDPMESYGRPYGKSGRYLLGGWHLTAWMYTPHELYKTLGNRDSAHHLPDEWLQHLKAGRLDDWLSSHIATYFPGRYRQTADLLKDEPYRSQPELLQPPTVIANNPDRFEAWFGKTDRRLRLPVRHA